MDVRLTVSNGTRGPTEDNVTRTPSVFCRAKHPANLCLLPVRQLSPSMVRLSRPTKESISCRRGGIDDVCVALAVPVLHRQRNLNPTRPDTGQPGTLQLISLGNHSRSQWHMRPSAKAPALAQPVAHIGQSTYRSQRRWPLSKAPGGTPWIWGSPGNCCFSGSSK